MSLMDLLMGCRPFRKGSQTTHRTGDHLQEQLRAFKNPLKIYRTPLKTLKTTYEGWDVTYGPTDGFQILLERF